MPSLAELLRDVDPAAAFHAPPSWWQGRTVYGGLSSALALHAVLHEHGASLPPLKCAQVSFVGPAMQALRFRTQRLRQGKSATSIGVDAYSGEELALRIAFLFAQPRPSRIAHDLSQRMAVPAPEALPRFDAGGQGPASLVNFDIRLAGGALPVSGAAVPELVAWARHVDARDVDPAVALLALGDCLPPAALDAFTAMAPVSSMTWTIDLAQPAASGEWFLLRSTSLHAADGYSFQTMEIRDAAGALAACGSQTVALFA